MITHRTSMRSAVAALGVGAAIALTVSSPAFAANEGTYQGNWGGCTATEEIQVQYVNGGYHDQMEFFPTGTGPNCLFDIIDNNSVVWTSTGAGSGWRYDGPGNYMCPQIHDKVTGVLKWQGVCN
ncbi:hypothetical protein [Streptacidiphilus albus]|jgi:hypothetical protein|uniref:hypothetical protein n=1 Tax=Streptacidiphilus albus TaxID=105425 RepID=UPI000AFFC4B6|nr:hypothetical protein [Streptacidiphilus albus]